MKNIISIIITCLDQLRYTIKCVESIRKHTPETYEIIFVDSGSMDWEVKWLRNLVKENQNYHLIEDSNKTTLIERRNDAIETSSGNYIVCLNNDVVVTDKWLSGMIECINSVSDAGIVGPMTNDIRGVQKVVDYDSIDRLEDYAKSFRSKNRYRRVTSRKIAGFCMLFRRDLVEKIGLFDKNLGPGNVGYEDYCIRAALEGYRNLIAGDVFVHNYGNRSYIGNKKILAEKWNGIDKESSLGKKILTLKAVEKADKLNQNGRAGNAVDIFLKGIGYFPEAKWLYHRLSEILINNRQFEDALDILDETPLSDQDLRKLELSGYCKEGMQLYDEAEAFANRVLTLNPASASALNLKGILAYRKGAKSTAEIFFNKAIESDPGYGEPYTNLGILKWDIDQEKALNFFKRGFILSPAVMDIVTIYHTAVTALGEFKRAERAFREANALHPHNKRLKYLLIDMLIKQGKHDPAMEEIEAAMIAFGMDDGILSSALKVRNILGPKKIGETSGKRATVSLCMIVKNEEQYLAKCLMSAKPVVDEMIVVDTGSTDKTKDIAKAFGAKVYDFKWTNDFSKARNYSISKASGDWIFVLDADEIISSLDYEYLREIVRSSASEPVAYSFVTRNYTMRTNIVGWTANDGQYGREEAGTGWIPTEKVRLFPNESRIRFEYPVHEVVEPFLKRGGIEIKKCSLPIHHYGPLNNKKTNFKDEVYYRIGRKKLDETGDDVVAIRELAIQAGILGKHKEAIELWQKFIALRPCTPEAFVNMGTAYWQLGKYSDALVSSRRAMELAPQMKEALYNFTISELLVGNIKKVIPVLENLLKRFPEYLPARFMMAAAFCCNGGKEKGLEGLKKLRRTAMAPHLAATCYDLAKRLISVHRHDCAISLLEAAIESKNVNKGVVALFSECRKMSLSS